MLFAILFAATLHTAYLDLNGHCLKVEIADNPISRKQGLMGRKALPQGEGMLFIFEQPGILSFWMKNTLIPLSIGFFDASKRLIQMMDMCPGIGKEEDLPIYLSRSLASYALEVPLGWFEEHNICIGMKFTFLDSLNHIK